MRRWVVFLGLVSAACTGREGGLTGRSGTPGSATVRVVNAAPGGPSIDVVVGGTPIGGGANLAFGANTSCISVPANAPGLQVRVAGTTSVVPGLTLSLLPLTHYTLLVLGETGTNRFATLTDNVISAGAGRTRLRILNGVTHIGTVDAFVTAPGAPLGSPTHTSLAPDVGSAFVDLPSGSRRVRFTATGTLTPVLDSVDVSLTDSRAETLVLTDAPGGPGFAHVTAVTCQ